MKNNVMKLQLFGADEDEVVNTLSELDLEYKHLSAEQQLEIAKIAQLRRIAGSLEGIEGSLEKLTGCSDGQKLYISGEISEIL